MKALRFIVGSVFVFALVFSFLLLCTFVNSSFATDGVWECNLYCNPSSGPVGTSFNISGYSRLDRDSYTDLLFSIYMQDEFGGYREVGYDVRFVEGSDYYVEGHGTIPSGAAPSKYKLIVGPHGSDYEHLVTYYLGCSEFTVTSGADGEDGGLGCNPSSGPRGTKFTIYVSTGENTRQWYEALTNIDGEPLFSGDFAIVLLNAPSRETGLEQNWPVGSAWFVDNEHVEGRGEILSDIAEGTYPVVVCLNALGASWGDFTNAAELEFTVTPSDGLPGWVYVAGGAAIGVGGGAILIGKKFLGKRGKKPSTLDYPSEAYDISDRKKETASYTELPDYVQESERREMRERWEREARERGATFEQHVQRERQRVARQKALKKKYEGLRRFSKKYDKELFDFVEYHKANVMDYKGTMNEEQLGKLERYVKRRLETKQALAKMKDASAIYWDELIWGTLRAATQGTHIRDVRPLIFRVVLAGVSGGLSELVMMPLSGLVTMRDTIEAGGSGMDAFIEAEKRAVGVFLFGKVFKAGLDRVMRTRTAQRIFTSKLVKKVWRFLNTDVTKLFGRKPAPLPKIKPGSFVDQRFEYVKNPKLRAKLKSLDDLLHRYNLRPKPSELYGRKDNIVYLKGNAKLQRATQKNFNTNIDRKCLDILRNHFDEVDALNASRRIPKRFMDALDHTRHKLLQYGEEQALRRLYNEFPGYRGQIQGAKKTGALPGTREYKDWFGKALDNASDKDTTYLVDGPDGFEAGKRFINYKDQAIRKLGVDPNKLGKTDFVEYSGPAGETYVDKGALTVLELESNQKLGGPRFDRITESGNIVRDCHYDCSLRVRNWEIDYNSGKMMPLKKPIIEAPPKMTKHLVRSNAQGQLKCLKAHLKPDMPTEGKIRKFGKYIFRGHVGTSNWPVEARIMSKMKANNLSLEKAVDGTPYEQLYKANPKRTAEQIWNKGLQALKNLARK